MGRRNAHYRFNFTSRGCIILLSLSIFLFIHVAYASMRSDVFANSNFVHNSISKNNCLTSSCRSTSISLFQKQTSLWGMSRSHSAKIISSNFILHGIRGGAQPSNTNARTFWNTNANKNNNSNSYNYRQAQEDTFSVTDVTDELKEEERSVTKEAIDSFLTRESRNSFIARVYMILSVQLTMVVGSILMFAKFPNISRFFITKGRLGTYKNHVQSDCRYTIV